ncbi:LLM class flavin-dependent oxidoreductase [Cupriavidus sp. PET2-C1]
MQLSLQRKMRLNAFLMHTGHHVAAWRHPEVPASAAVDFKHYQHLAKIAEAAKFDAIFLADHVGVNAGGSGENIAVQQRTARANTFEPLTLLAALAVTTEDIGLIATVSTSYNEPFNVARKFASLDHLSKGRVGWNVVTSATETEAKNFGLDQQREHALRYERAGEFVDIVRGLWDSWADDAFHYDKATARYFDPDAVQSIDHRGKHYQVKGPLNIARSPQGQPVIVQAGSSETGQELAARTAEIVFTAQQSLSSAQSFYGALKGRLAKYGRQPDELAVMPGLFAMVGQSEAHAREKLEQLQELLPAEVGIGLLSAQLGGVDLSGYDLDAPFPEHLPEPAGAKGRFLLLTTLARQEELTIRQLYHRVATARGHWSIAGTASQIADQMQEWFENGAADGFNVMAPYLPGGLEDFASSVVPELQRRGLFRKEYEGKTLRDRFGLLRPERRVR